MGGAGAEAAGAPSTGAAGAAGASCADTGCAGGPCVDAGCAAPPCPTGFADCNGKANDGCETPLDTSSNCTACGLACTNAHGTTQCVGSAGSSENDACLPKCIAGYADCDLNPNNGCETDINTDSVNCGACGKACSAQGGTPRCAGGLCGVSSCNPGFGDCTNSGSCNQNLNSDPLNCGHCGHICSSAHGTPSCNAGLCEITCQAGYGDCNANASANAAAPDDGCETTLNVPDGNGSVPNCGACGAACTRRAYTTIDLASCAKGTCARDCLNGTGDCDNNRNNPACTGSDCGCEVSLASNASNCGACGHACLGGACVNDACQCPDTKPTSGTTKCTLAGTVSCGPYATGCHCTCSSGLFQCTDGNGKAC